MSRRPATITQADITRAIRAARQAGLHVASCRINPQTGEIVVVTGKPTAQDSGTASREGSNEWDSV